MKMPPANKAIIAKRSQIVKAFRTILPEESVIDDSDELQVYETDGLTAYHQSPMIVVLPETTAQVSEILNICSAEDKSCK